MTKRKGMAALGLTNSKAVLAKAQVAVSDFMRARLKEESFAARLFETAFLPHLHALVERFHARHPGQRCLRLEQRLLYDPMERGRPAAIKEYLKACPDWMEGETYLLCEAL